MDQRASNQVQVLRWRESGLSQKAFCHQSGIKLGTFAYWVAKSKEEKKHGFIPLVSERSNRSVEYEVIYPNGVKVKINSFDLKTLSGLIHLY